MSEIELGERRIRDGLTRRDFVSVGAFTTLGLVAPKPVKAGDSPYLAALKTAADRIVSATYLQTDGAISMGGGTQVNPYFSCHAVIGLAHACKIAKKPQYAQAMRGWLTWYAQHLNADGTIDDFTGSPGQWKPDASPDSTDAYAATFLEALSEAIPIVADAKWRKQMAPFATKAVGAMRLTLQKKYGLTTATPAYPVMYTIDNVEVWRGERSAAVIAGIDTADGKKRLGQADATLAAIRSLLRDKNDVFYLYGMQTDGYQFNAVKTMSNWYPEQMAQLAPIAWLPLDSRHQDLYNQMKTQYFGALPLNVGETNDTWQIKEEKLGKLLFWAMAAETMGDKATATTLLDRMLDFDARMGAFYNVALYGWLCRAFAYALK